MTDIIIREDEDGLDEVVGEGSFHLERMSDTEWWLGLETAEGQSVHVWISSKNGRAHVEAMVLENVKS